MNHSSIVITNAHTHNLKSINLEIPKHRLVVFTGVSGSGKSSLLFDTIYTEAQRQLIETFSTFAQTRMPKLSRPDVDDIQNLSTAIVIDQKRLGTNLRSTVGTATEVNTYLRLLFSRVGEPFIGPSFLYSFNHPDGMCQHCKGLGKRVQVDVDSLIDFDRSIREGAVLYPGMGVGSWFWREVVAINLFDVDTKLKDFSSDELNQFLYTEPIPISKEHGAGVYSKNYEGIARKLERAVSDKAEDEAPEEQKDAYSKFLLYTHCSYCKGTRLTERALSVTIQGLNIAQLCDMELIDALNFIASIEGDIAAPMVRKIKFILENLVEIGVGYLSLSRSVSTLSGGESQRVKMARQLDCNLVDLLYILDEPSIGLHPRDTDKLIGMLRKLRDKGNSVMVVEHDTEVIKSAEWIVDMGPRAGALGGQVVYSGEPKGLLASSSITAQYLNNGIRKKERERTPKGFLTIENASANNLKGVSVQIPIGALTCVTGVAGSGKSSLIHECFSKKFPDAIAIDQSPIGRTSRGNLATFTGVFDAIRKEFANATGAPPSLFSFNSKGACPKCNGQGTLSFELHFLDAVRTQCDECDGKRYKHEVLGLKYKSVSIADVLDMTVEQSNTFFDLEKINGKLQLLSDVGLSYLKIGQPLSTLSGGEAQRLKIAAELHKQGNIYIMDEPTTGLHPSDIDRLNSIISKLADQGNTVVVIEHNLDVIRQADWIIDMGPEGGNAGGEVLYQGGIKGLKGVSRSYTGRYL